MDEILKKLDAVFYELIDKVDQVYMGLNPCFVGDSISDSFTVLVGFVAIGIPLSLQVISRATEKYKSDHLIKYLSRWKLVTPKRIYWVSIFYFIFALFFKSILPLHSEDCGSPDIQPYAWAVIFMFFIIIILIGLWYGHLFSQAAKRPMEIYDALKK